MPMSTATRWKQLEKLLRMLAEQGEEKTFAYIRHIRREAKKRGA